MENRKRIVVCLFICLFAWVNQGCTGNASNANQEPPTAGIDGVTQPPQGKFFFVQMWTHYEGVSMTISRPLYGFNPTTYVLDTRLTANQFPPEKWGLIGKGVSAIGAGSGLVIVSSMPYETQMGTFTGNVNNGTAEMKDVSIKILAISADGKLSLEIDGQPFILEVNEKWEYSNEANFMKDGLENHYQITSSITNYGWLDRSLIQFNP